MKCCPTCGVEKHLREFHRRKDGRHSRCKDCRKQEGKTEARRAYAKAYREANRDVLNAKQRAWVAANRAEQRDYQMVRRYGITMAERDEMLAQQGGVCAICGTDSPARRWATDHDHSCCPGEKTCGKCLRGILCESCNAGIGQFKDDPAILRRAAAYAER